MKSFRCWVCLASSCVDCVNLTWLGRVRSVRVLGSKLLFLDIERDKQRLQAMVELKKYYAIFDEKCLSKIPKGPSKDKKLH